jgi:hypothetical protein
VIIELIHTSHLHTGDTLKTTSHHSLLFTKVAQNDATVSVSELSIFTIFACAGFVSIIVPLYEVCKFVINSILLLLSDESYSGSHLFVSLYDTNFHGVNSNHPSILNLLVP